MWCCSRWASATETRQCSRERDHVAHVEVVGHDLRAVEQREAEVEQRVRVGVDAVEQHALVAYVAQAGVEHRLRRLGHQRGHRRGVVDVGVHRQRDAPVAGGPGDPLDAGADLVLQPVLGEAHQRLGGQPDVADVLDLEQAGEELLEPRPGHVRHVAAGDHDVAHRRRTAQVVEHLRVPVDRLAEELQLVDDRGGVADEVHARAVAAVLRAGRQQLGEHLGRVAVGEALGHPHVVLVQRVAGGVRVRRASRCAGRRTPGACSDGPGRRTSPRSASRGRAGSRAAPSCSSSAAAPASTWWPARAWSRSRSS